MLEEIYTMLGYENIFDNKNIEKLQKAHNAFMSFLLICQNLGIISSINEAKIDEIENSDGLY